MELLFLVLLILLMVAALTSGFPVAFALPGSAIIAIGLAALCGWLFAGDVDAFFAEGGPTQWLSAGVTNFRSLYWDVERDTLIAIPLFIFMGIMLQRSKIAEDLLVAMARLFGPVPGGLGISVIIVGALLAATTGIVGATVIAMGLISLPAMLRNNYSKPMACGAICASGTLGQIIPPSIVLIILADQLSSAADQASTMRKADYKAATGEFSMPSVYDITSASAGDMFMGAMVPGLILVGIYILYILISALINPASAPPVPREGKLDREFARSVVLALVPPLTLIFVVLGSIIMGVATVNQAGAVGAVGAIIMGGYRLIGRQKNTYYPAILAIGSVVAIGLLHSAFDLNIKSASGQENPLPIFLAVVASLGLLTAVGWSTLRIHKTHNTLVEVMVETAKTTSMVFIILIGAAMLTSAFRAFGGEHLVKEFLTGLPGGFWGQFIVVMLVIFLLGFFLDFIEIAVVVVPIVAPILLADPEANITAVWLGVMIGLNIQTSFLTPPFGFALFYLRGVAPPIVKTLHIYKGVIIFIGLQLLALVVVGFNPSMVNYLPNRSHLTSETAAPPMNPRLQSCLEEYVFEQYATQESELRAGIAALQGVEVSYLPDNLQRSLAESQQQALETFALVDKIHAAEAAVDAYLPEYRPLHRKVRQLQDDLRGVDALIDKTERDLTRAQRTEPVVEAQIDSLSQRLKLLQAERAALAELIPAEWEGARKRYLELAKAEERARNIYRNNSDSAYEVIKNLRGLIDSAPALQALESQLQGLEGVITAAITPELAEPAMDQIEAVERVLGDTGASSVKSALAKARRALKKEPDVEKAAKQLQQALARYQDELQWRQRAQGELATALANYDAMIKSNIGIRMQARLTVSQAEEIASCQSVHKDVSLHF